MDRSATFSPAEAVPAVRAIHTKRQRADLSFPWKGNGEAVQKILALAARPTANRDRHAASLCLGNADIYSSVVTLIDRALLPTESIRSGQDGDVFVFVCRV
jgi:hypothetical protein